MAKTLDMQLARRLDTWVGLLICGVLFAWSRIHARLGGPPQPPLRATTPPRLGAPPRPAPRRVLAIKFYGLGNLIMLFPVLGTLRKAYPDVEIDFLTMAENRILLEHSGVASQILPVEVRSFRSLLRSMWSIWKIFRARRYDLVLDFEQFVKLSTILSFLTGAPERIGFNTDGQRRGFLYTTRVVYTDSEHMSGIFMRLLRPLEIDTTPAPPRIANKPEDEAIVEQLLAQGGVAPDHFPLIVVHVGSGPNFYRIAIKRWPIPNFAWLADELIERYGAALVFTGKGAEERVLVDEVLSCMRHEAIDACDQLDITQLTALLERCHLTIVNDTSVMHLSAFLRTPTVSFFGPTSPIHYGPGNPEDLVVYKDLYCSPCLTNYNLKVSRCSEPVCIRMITPEEVLEATEARFLREEAPLRAYLESRGRPVRDVSRKPYS